MLCSLEADLDQVGSVVPCEVEGTGAANGCTRSLGGMEAPGALVETRVPSVNVPVCVVKGVSAPPCMDETPCVEETPCASSVLTSVSECVLPSTPCVNGAPRVKEAVCVSEQPSVRETACVRSLCVTEMSVGMREHAAASPGVSAMSWSLSLVTRGSLSAWVERRRRLRQLRDKGRVAAVVLMGTVPGWHSSERAVRAVQRTRPPRARLRE